MDREEILKASRREHGERDLVEQEVTCQGGSHAGRVGALVCCLLSLLAAEVAHVWLYSPWVIYFSMTAARWFVRFRSMKRRSDLALAFCFLALAFCFLALAALAFAGFLYRLWGVAA